MTLAFSITPHSLEQLLSSVIVISLLGTLAVIVRYFMYK